MQIQIHFGIMLKIGSKLIQEGRSLLVGRDSIGNLATNASIGKNW